MVILKVLGIASSVVLKVLGIASGVVLAFIPFVYASWIFFDIPGSWIVIGLATYFIMRQISRELSDTSLGRRPILWLYPYRSWQSHKDDLPG